VRLAPIDLATAHEMIAELPVTQAVRRWALAEGSPPVVSAIGTAVKLSPTDAALVNGAAAHGLDFDDGQTRGSVHPGGTVFSAALAAAERRGSSMAEFVDAVVLGYDVLLRIASAMHPHSARLGWHNTPVAGVFGAAAVAARLAGLDARTTRDALGLAASFSGGLRQYLRDGAEVTRLHPGKAARDGLVCAGLAAEGITGPFEALEGPEGLFNAMIAGKADHAQITEGLGRSFLIETAYFKPYPCCRHFHAGLDAVLDLRREAAITSADVAQVQIGIYSVGFQGHDHKTARNLLEAQMSAPCAATAALINGRLGAPDFEPEAFLGAEPQRLLAATSVYVDDECDRVYPKMRGGVAKLTLTDGRVLERRVLDPRGEGGNPLTDEDLSGKFLGNAIGPLGAERAERLLDLIWRADRGADLAAILALLVPAKEAL
jgi:2-methylcitrate dehydratase PrpD